MVSTFKDIHASLSLDLIRMSSADTVMLLSFRDMLGENVGDDLKLLICSCRKKLDNKFFNQLLKHVVRLGKLI